MTNRNEPATPAFLHDRLRSIDGNTLDLLAMLSLAGDSGLDRPWVASFFAFEEDSAVNDLLRELHAAGIPVEAPSDPTRIAIRQPTLRASLAQELFFGERGLDYRRFANPLDGLEPLKTLLDLARSGARVPRELLVEELVTRTTTLSEDPLLSSPFYPGTSLVSVFKTFARMGPEESRLALEHYRENRIADIAEALLLHLPEPTLDRLLGLTPAENEDLQTLRPLAVVTYWLETTSDPRSPLERRELLLNVLARRSQQGFWQQNECDACLAILSPVLRTGNSANTLLESGTESEFRKLTQRAISLLLRSTPDLPWGEINQALARFHWPEPRTEETQRIGKSLLTAALEQLAERAKVSLPERFAWLLTAEELAFEGPVVSEIRAGYEDELAEAEILFPSTRSQPSEFSSIWLERWSQPDPNPILARWRTLIPYAKRLEPIRSDDLDRITKMVAERTPAPLVWIRNLVDMPVHEKALRPFLTRLDEADFGGIAPKLLGLENYRWSAALEVVRRSAPANLLLPALQELESNLPRLREEVRFNAELAIAMAHRHLHGETKVSWILATAILALPRLEDLDLKRAARSTLLTRPILPGLPIAIWAGLCNDLARDSELAADWLIALSLLPQPPRSAGVPEWYSSERELSHMIGARLPLPAKIRILRNAAPAFLGRFAPELVGQDPELYRLLIAAGVSPEAIALPLEGMRPGPAWIPFAEAAQDAGLAATNIARQAILHGMWGGSPAEIQTWMAALRNIEIERPHLLEVAREGLKMAETRLTEALEIQKRIEMRGLVAGG